MDVVKDLPFKNKVGLLSSCQTRGNQVITADEPLRIEKCERGDTMIK